MQFRIRTKATTTTKRSFEKRVVVLRKAIYRERASHDIHFDP